ncbi:hypothetical protein FACS1894151_07870 [Spirochaetia bacterium]|nr:hypothetical protein FACS1894151_07870 [Spirochaetia bacterium]
MTNIGKRLKNLGIIFGLGFFIVSCATNPEVYRVIDEEVNRGNFEAAITALEEGQAKKTPIYPGGNRVMLALDRGMLEHYAGYYRESSEDLQQGEILIEEAYTKSLSQEITTYIANDNTRDYPGEDYEDIYINTFNALNYYNRGDLNGAMVEIRRSNEKLAVLSDRYAAGMEEIEAYADDQGGNVQYDQDTHVNIANLALARYLGTLFHRARGSMDDARIDFVEIHRAYAAAPSVYRNPMPSSLAISGTPGRETGEELNIPAGMARLNILSFTGLSPVKEEYIQNILFPPPHDYVRVALPVMVERPSVINRVELVFDNGESMELELLEDMGLVAMETFKVKQALIYLKTYIRTFVKLAATAVGAAVAQDQGGDWAGLLVGVAGLVATNVSESADIRMSRYFPRYAYIGGINVEPGTYSFTVNYYEGSRRIHSERRENVRVNAGALNLVETFCLQ